ncbi:MAG TPA: GNAT family N-acetyltransferase [Actinomycetota bacterium]
MDRTEGTIIDALRYAASPMPVTVHVELGEIDTLGPPWHELLSADPTASVFQTPEYAHVWWEEFGALRALALLEIRDDDGDLIGIAPLSMEPDGSVHFVGDPSISDYLAPVSRPEHRDAIASIVVEFAAAMDGFTRLSLSGLPADSGWPEALAAAAKAAGLVPLEEPEDICPVAATHGSFEAYLAHLTGKHRHEIRRKARRLSEAAEITLRSSTATSLDADLDAFFALHRSSDGPKGKFMHDDMESYFRRLAWTMQRAGRLRLTSLDMDGTPVAMLYGFSDGRRWELYNSSYDHAKRDLSPGMVLVAETIKLAAEEGCETFDFLRGAEDYKYRFGAVDRPVVRLTTDPA